VADAVLHSMMAADGPSMAETPVPIVPARPTTSTTRRMMRDLDNLLVVRRITVRPEDTGPPPDRAVPRDISEVTDSGLRRDRPGVGPLEDNRRRDGRSEREEATLFSVDGAVDSNRRVEEPSPPK